MSTRNGSAKVPRSTCRAAASMTLNETLALVTGSCELPSTPAAALALIGASRGASNAAVCRSSVAVSHASAGETCGSPFAVSTDCVSS